MRELRDCWWLQALGENDLLSLKANIFGPLDEALEVSFGLDILAYKRSSVTRHPVVVQAKLDTD